jgi:DNA replication protein DnaC
MDQELQNKLKYLGLKTLLGNWEQTIETAEKNHVSYSRLITEIIEKEYSMKKEFARINRIKKAGMPEQLCMETYPFELQPKFSKKRIMQAYDSKDYLHKNSNIAFIGPTGCGKSGLATSFLIQALNLGYSGKFVSFPDLISDLFSSIADHSQKMVLQKYANYSVLVVDEIGYVEMEPTQIGLFYTLMNKRHKKSSTIITSNLGFREWDVFLKNKQLTAAIIDRLTSNCTVFNMRECQSLRHGAEQTEAQKY